MRVQSNLPLRTSFMALASLSFVLTSSLSAAQNSPQLLNRVSPSGYVLGPGDQLNIHVVDLEEFADKTVKIDPDGGVDLPLIGILHPSGESLDAFKSDLRRRLTKYIQSPKVSVNLISNRSSRISVIGEVSSPGVRELSGPTTLIEAISEAGGLKADAGSRVLITRTSDQDPLTIDNQKIDSNGKFTTATVSLDELMTAKHPEENVTLRPGDVVSIPKASIVYVVGDVHRSGGFPITTRSTMTVLQALALAEGLSTNNASKNAKILRPSQDGDVKPIQIPVNVQAILAGKAQDPPLFADDILFIPHSTAEAGAKRAAEIVLQVAAGVLIYR